MFSVSGMKMLIYIKRRNNYVKEINGKESAS